jgi:hypothetical protein
MPFQCRFSPCRLRGLMAVGLQGSWGEHPSRLGERHGISLAHAWSSACQGESAAAAPIFDQSVIVHHTAGDMARRIILKVAPDLP